MHSLLRTRFVTGLRPDDRHGIYQRVSVLLWKSNNIAGDNSVIRCFFDGAVEPMNPGGHGGFGVVVRRDDKVIYTESSYMGRWPSLSNNCSEYAGAIAVFRYLIREGINEASVFGDADLIINQLNGKWKVKSGAYVPYFAEAKTLRDKLPRVTLTWIPREQNAEADELSKIAVIKRPRVVSFALDATLKLNPIEFSTHKKKQRFRKRERPVHAETDDESWHIFKLRYGDL